MKLASIIMMVSVLAGSKKALDRASTYPFIASITHILQKPCSGVLYTRNTVITIKHCAQHPANEYIVTPYRDDKGLVSKLGVDFFRVKEIITDDTEYYSSLPRLGLNVMKLNSTDSRSTGIVLDIAGATALRDGEFRLIGWSQKETFLPPFKSLGDYSASVSQDLMSSNPFQFSYGSSVSNPLACKFNSGSLLVYYSESGRPILTGIRTKSPCKTNKSIPTYISIQFQWLWIHALAVEYKSSN